MLAIAQKALLIDDQRRVLVLKSTDADGNGNYWDFPGGRMELGETPLQTLEREIKEETSLNVDVATAKLLHVGWYKGFGDRAQEDVYKTFWVVPVQAASAVLSWEHKEFSWLQLSNLPADFTGPYRDIVDNHLATILDN